VPGRVERALCAHWARLITMRGMQLQRLRQQRRPALFAFHRPRTVIEDCLDSLSQSCHDLGNTVLQRHRHPGQAAQSSQWSLVLGGASCQRGEHAEIRLALGQLGKGAPSPVFVDVGRWRSATT
jgi:hypothetical protein